LSVRVLCEHQIYLIYLTAVNGTLTLSSSFFLNLPEFSTGIIHGTKAPDNSIPYMGSVQNNKGQHVCGEFLITEDFVLTAAHCDRL
uniref:Peptidase S1 domain-containing protein n=1 Tax=Astatotilapia calliptera TaxID=8154 RepID=A0A3P8RFC9_ASTCA